MPRKTTDAGSQALTAIYAALAMGVFVFAAVVLFVLDPLEASLDPGLMKIVWFVAAIIATLGAGIIRGRMAGGKAGPDASRTAAILVWALAEGQALLGIVGTMLTGDRVTAYASLALFVWLWMRYPPGKFVRG